MDTIILDIIANEWFVFISKNNIKGINWMNISMSPNITWDIIQSNPQLPWVT
jgi:hypothetical protein